VTEQTRDSALGRAGRAEFTYPSLSEKSRVLKRAGATLLTERHLKMDSLPLRQAVQKVSVRVLTSDDFSHDFIYLNGKDCLGCLPYLISINNALNY